MHYERINKVYTADGQTVQVRFDLSDEQLSAVARAADAVKTARYRCATLDADAVLELRELMAIHDDALDRAQDGCFGGTLVMTVGRLGLLNQALQEWLADHDTIAASHVDGVLDSLTDLHARALRVALGADEPEPAFG